MTYVIAAAGTGGHVFPALAVGEALVSQGVRPDEVLFIGGSRMEKQEVPDAGFPFRELELVGLQRRLTAANLKIPLVVIRAVSAITDEIRNREARVVLGLGGYVTVPAGLAARRASVALAVSEQNAHAGLANRLMSKLAVRSFGAFAETEGMPRAEWVGNPIRPSVLTPVSRAEARTGYGLDPEGLVVGVFGGSLGAGALNDATEVNAAAWAQQGVTVLHLVGERNAHLIEQSAGVENWRVVAFESEMQRFYAACDLVVARAGGAVAELTATTTPSILVPGGFGSGGHQEANAAHLETAGAAVTLPEPDLARLGALVIELITDQTRLAAMRSGCERLARPDAAANIASVLRSLHG